MTTTISGIRSRFVAIARDIGAPKRHVRFATRSTELGAPHVEQRGDTFAYVVRERGEEIERRETSDPDELLYWLVSDLTWAMASEHGLPQRREGVDSRRPLFEEHLRLLGLARAEWARRKRAEYDEVLRAHPFSDG